MWGVCRAQLQRHTHTYCEGTKQDRKDGTENPSIPSSIHPFIHPSIPPVCQTARGLEPFLSLWHLKWLLEGNVPWRLTADKYPGMPPKWAHLQIFTFQGIRLYSVGSRRFNVICFKNTVCLPRAATQKEWAPHLQIAPWVYIESYKGNTGGMLQKLKENTERRSNFSNFVHSTKTLVAIFVPVFSHKVSNPWH